VVNSLFKHVGSGRFVTLALILCSIMEVSLSEASNKGPQWSHLSSLYRPTKDQSEMERTKGRLRHLAL
jgi:hypothetical protein